MKSVKFKVPYESHEKAIENLERQEKFIKEHGFEAWLDRVGLSELIPHYRKNKALESIKNNEGSK